METVDKDAVKDFKESVKTVKLLLSSLFARKLPKMIVSYTSPGVFYFTNIESERIALYKATPEDVLSKVKIVSENVLRILYEAFPFMKESICEIDVSTMGSVLNKSLQVTKDKYPEAIVDKDSNSLKLVYKDKDGNNQTVVAGKLLTEWEFDFYTEILTKFDKFSDNVIKRQFRYDAQESDSKVTIEIVEVAGKNGSSEFGLPVSDGLNLVSSREYIRRRGLDPLYDLWLQFDEGTHTSKATIHYLDDWLDACTIMPGSLWFMTRKVL